MSYTPYEDGEYPQLDYMYTEDGDRILIEHDLGSPDPDDQPSQLAEEWDDDLYYNEITYADEIDVGYDGD